MSRGCRRPTRIRYPRLECMMKLDDIKIGEEYVAKVDMTGGNRAAFSGALSPSRVTVVKTHVKIRGIGSGYGRYNEERDTLTDGAYVLVAVGHSNVKAVVPSRSIIMTGADRDAEWEAEEASREASKRRWEAARAEVKANQIREIAEIIAAQTQTIYPVAVTLAVELRSKGFLAEVSQAEIVEIASKLKEQQNT